MSTHNPANNLKSELTSLVGGACRYSDLLGGQLEQRRAVLKHESMGRVVCVEHADSAKEIQFIERNTIIDGIDYLQEFERLACIDSSDRMELPNQDEGNAWFLAGNANRVIVY